MGETQNKHEIYILLDSDKHYGKNQKGPGKRKVRGKEEMAALRCSQGIQGRLLRRGLLSRLKRVSNLTTWPWKCANQGGWQHRGPTAFASCHVECAVEPIRQLLLDSHAKSEPTRWAGQVCGMETRGAFRGHLITRELRNLGRRSCLRNKSQTKGKSNLENTEVSVTWAYLLVQPLQILKTECCDKGKRSE